MVATLDQQINRWLRKMGIPVADSLLQEKLSAHPDYPSLLAATDVLDELGIDNAALIIDKERLSEVPLPFLAHDVRKKEFVLINNIEKQITTNPEFEKYWSGTALLAEKPENWHHPENEKRIAQEKKNKQLLLLSIFAAGLLAIASLLNGFSWQMAGLMLFTLAGLGIAVLIAQHELGISNELTEQLCSAGKNTDCDAVMNAKKEGIAKWMDWGNAAIIYFSSYTLLLICFLYTENSVGISVLALLSLATIPVTFFSLYYQWRVVKKWCTLCLFTVGVLWLQTAITLNITNGLFVNFANIDTLYVIKGILFIAFVFLTIAALWVLMLKPVLQKNTSLANTNFSLLRFKNNPLLFETLLKTQRQVDTTPFENDLQIGNPDAVLQLVVACNPFCRPCAKAHSELHVLLSDNDIGLTIRFSVKAESIDNLATQTVSYILQLVNGKDNKYKKEVLNDWYTFMNLEKFKEKYPLSDVVEVGIQLVQHEEWNKTGEIKFTPTVFINSYQLPKKYNVADLKILLKKLNFKEEKKELSILENNLAI